VKVSKGHSTHSRYTRRLSLVRTGLVGVCSCARCEGSGEDVWKGGRRSFFKICAGILMKRVERFAVKTIGTRMIEAQRGQLHVLGVVHGGVELCGVSVGAAQ